LDSTNLEMSEIPENSAENISDISEEVVPKSKKLSYQERLKQTRKTLAESEKEIFKNFRNFVFDSLAPFRIWLSSVDIFEITRGCFGAIFFK